MADLEPMIIAIATAIVIAEDRGNPITVIVIVIVNAIVIVVNLISCDDFKRR